MLFSAIGGCCRNLLDVDPYPQTIDTPKFKILENTLRFRVRVRRLSSGDYI